MAKIDEIISTKEYKSELYDYQTIKERVEGLVDDKSKQPSKLEELYVLRKLEEEKVQKHDPTILACGISVIISLFVFSVQQAVSFFMELSGMGKIIMGVVWAAAAIIIMISFVFYLLKELKIKKESVKAKIAIVAIDECIKSLETSDQKNKC